ncbi:MAG: glycosyltransferase family 9 protein [Vicinamibacterales bacterium]
MRIPAGSVVNALLIRLRLIGDVVFTTPAIAALRRRFPQGRLSYLVEPEAAPVVLGNPHLDRVIVSPRPAGRLRLAAEFALARRLRAGRYDLVIDFHGGPRSSWLALATGAPRRIGYTVRGRSWMYTERVARPRALRPRHSVENQWDLLEPLGIGPPSPASDPTEMVEDLDARAAVDRKLAAAGVRAEEQPVVIHVSAGNPFRRWPAANFVSLVAALCEATDRPVVLTSGPSDASAARKIREEARDRAGGRTSVRIVECGEFDLRELHALLGRSALFIGGDSGPLHIAGTTQVPIIGLFGPTLSARSRPWRDWSLPFVAVEMEALPCRPCDQRRCIPGDFRCLANLAPDRVVAAAGQLLGVAHERRATRYGR